MMNRLADLTGREPVAVGSTFVAVLIVGTAYATGADPAVYVTALIGIIGIFTQVRQAVTPYAQALADLYESEFVEANPPMDYSFFVPDPARLEAQERLDNLQDYLTKLEAEDRIPSSDH